MKGTTNMDVATTRFGTVAVNEDQALFFPEGLPGFEACTQWVLLHDEQAPDLHWLQAVEDPDAALLLGDPDQLFSDYHVELMASDLRELGLDEEGDDVVMRVTLRRDDDDRFVANLQAPILINVENRRGTQVLLDDHRYPSARVRAVKPKTDVVFAGSESPDAAGRSQPGLV
jgi:flagellar assembly factor FliW